MEISSELLENCTKYLKEKSSAWSEGVCLGCCTKLTSDKVKDFSGAHTACHSWVPSAFGHVLTPPKSYGDWDRPYRDDAFNFLTLSCVSKTRSKTVCSGKAVEFLVNWVANESIFSPFILNRDDKETFSQGGVILLCGPDGLSLSQTMWVCKLLRFTTEGGKAAETFMTLVKGGVDPMLAVYVSSLIRTIKGATFGYTGVEGHSTVISAHSYECLLGMTSRGLNPKASTTTTVFKATKLPRAITAKIPPADVVRKFCQPYKKSDGWGGYVTGDGADADDLLRHVLDWQKELGEYIRPDVFPFAQQEGTASEPTKDTVYLDFDM